MVRKASPAGLLGLSLPSSHFADEVFQIAGFELRHGERPRRAGKLHDRPDDRRHDPTIAHRVVAFEKFHIHASFGGKMG